MEKEALAKTLIQLNQLAMYEIRQENYKRAIDYFTQSLVLEEKLGLKEQMAESFYNLATAFYLIHDYEEAHKKIEIAIILFKEFSKDDDLKKAQALCEEIELMSQTP